jgi:hypothetical protein
MSSVAIQDNLNILNETCKKLMSVLKKYDSQIEKFSQNKSDIKSELDNEDLIKSNISNSSSSSSAISSSSMTEAQQNFIEAKKVFEQQTASGNLDTDQHQSFDNESLNSNANEIKNTIISSLVTHSYEIAFTVKRIVCIMGAN